MIIVDYSGIAISSIFAMKMQVNEQIIRHMILNTLRMYNLKYRADYGRLVLAIDDGTWRREFFPEYKAGRKKARDESGIDWTELYRILDLVLEEIRTNLPYYVVQVKGCEADDVIASLVESTQEFGNSEPVMIVSADKDFVQLHRYGNVKQFSNTQKALVKEKDPVRYLREHILHGDSGDGVPNILSHNQTFINGERQKPLSKKRVEELCNNWDRIEELLDQDLLSNFRRNRLCIDLSYIPKQIVEKVINTYRALPKPRNNTLTYLVTKRCSNLIECAENFNNSAS